MDWNQFLPIGSLLTFSTALTGLCYVLIRAIRSIVETNIELNSELQESAKDRHESEQQHDAERAAWKSERADMQAQIDGLASKLLRVETDFTLYQASSQKVIDELSRELVKVKSQLAESRQEAQAMKQNVDDLTSALKVAQDRVKELEAREQELRLHLESAKRQIAELQRDLLSKDTDIKALQARVRELETELKKTQDERAALEAQNADLLHRLTSADPGEHDPAMSEPSETAAPDEVSHE